MPISTWNQWCEGQRCQNCTPEAVSGAGVLCTSLQRLCYFFAPFLLRCQDFHQHQHPQSTTERTARLEGRPTAAVLICKFNPINCDKGCQRRNKKSILETFFWNFNDPFSSSEARVESAGSFSHFQMFAVLMVTDYCCWVSMRDLGWKHVWPLLWEGRCYQRWHFGPALRFLLLKFPGRSYSCSLCPFLSPICSIAWWAVTTPSSSRRTTSIRGGSWQRRQLLLRWGKNFTRPLRRSTSTRSSSRERRQSKPSPSQALEIAWGSTRGRRDGCELRRLRRAPPPLLESTRNSAPRTASFGERWTAPRITGLKNCPKPL